MKQARKQLLRTRTRNSFLILLCLLLLPYGGSGLKNAEAQSSESQPPVNLALNLAATASSTTSNREADKAVDGSRDTYWQPSSIDREDMSVSLSVYFPEPASFNQIVLNLNRGDNLSSIAIDHSNDGTTWSQAYTKTTGIHADGQEQMWFDPVIASYVRVTLQLSRNLNVQVREMEIYMQTDDNGGVPSDIKELAFLDADGAKLLNNAEQTLAIGQTTSLQAQARRDNGEWLSLPAGMISYQAVGNSASIDASGSISALKVGATRIYAEVKLKDKVIKTMDYWIVVKDDTEFQTAAYVASTAFVHPTLKQKIGEAAIIEPGQALPDLSVMPYGDGSVSVKWLKGGKDDKEGGAVGTQSMTASTPLTFKLPKKIKKAGTYEIQMTFTTADGGNYYESLYFTIQSKKGVPEGQSQIAYKEKKGDMVYVPDYKGNRIIDFSNVGYMGGGVKLPDVQARVAVEPSGSDDTAPIQAAIDQVSQLPRDKAGFRGAVLLKKGTFLVSGTLYVRESGVVLRGEGKSDDGTIIRGTGTVKRNLIEVGGTVGQTIVENTATTIQDLYVPTGSLSFHVKDASSYKVGDNVIVRRIGNDRWIHEIGMDHIYMRPVTGGTKQWTAFNLDFDRVITAIDGDQITIDAPLSNAIEWQWGGGQLFKANEEHRIEQVGIENMRAISDFDPSKTDTKMDNEELDAPYYSDEDHAERFVMLNSVKNAWVREVDGYHLSYALVQIGRQAKWVTVQDSEVYDMVSIITGGRRYSIFIQGQMNLVQRNYTETSRHAFVFESRVQGPNVIYDSKGIQEYNTSEPHHRWSTGGLYDNVSARINIRDRAWLGSGHGWAGANYVTWNTEGGLVAQKPPTAQNYAIGHVSNGEGKPVLPLVPNEYDTRPREDGYWESEGQHVALKSLYVQQLQDRLGENAVNNLVRTPIGGGSLDVPTLN